MINADRHHPIINYIWKEPAYFQFSIKIFQLVFSWPSGANISDQTNKKKQKQTRSPSPSQKTQINVDTGLVPLLAWGLFSLRWWLLQQRRIWKVAYSWVTIQFAISLFTVCCCRSAILSLTYVGMANSFGAKKSPALTQTHGWPSVQNTWIGTHWDAAIPCFTYSIIVYRYVQKLLRLKLPDSLFAW